MCLSHTRGKNHKNWLPSRFGNFYSRSCNFFDSYQITLKAYLDDTIYGNEQCWRKITSKKVCLSQTKGKDRKDWLFCGLGNSYSKSCYFFDSNNITIETYWDDTIDGNEQCWRKITSKKVRLSQTKGKTHNDWLYCGFEISYCNQVLLLFW